MTREDARERGRKFAQAHIDVVRRAHGDTVAAAYAHGMAWTARDLVYDVHDARAAYDMMQDLADGAITPVLQR
jgi:hypothetical protein